MQSLQSLKAASLPLGHFAPEPHGLVRHDAVPREVHQDLDGLVVVDDPLSSDHVAQTVHSVCPTKRIGASWIAKKRVVVS